MIKKIEWEGDLIDAGTGEVLWPVKWTVEVRESTPQEIACHVATFTDNGFDWNPWVDPNAPEAEEVPG